MVEAAAPGGAAANGGVIEGDILHALTVVMDRWNIRRRRPVMGEVFFLGVLYCSIYIYSTKY
jgi:hypothetical protein